MTVVSPNEPKRLKSPISPNSGAATRSPGTFGVVRPQLLHVGHRVDHDRDDRHRQDADEDGAPHLAGEEGDGQQDTGAEDQDRPAGQRAAGAELDRHGGVRDVRDTGDEPGVDEADEGDEQADADTDRLLERLRYGVHDGLAQSRDHQDADQQTFEDDQAHRVGPAHQRGYLEGDDRVEPEAGGEGERQVAADAHDDRHHRGHEGGGGDEFGAVEGVAVLVLGVAEDDGIQDKDVRHREERGEAAAYLTGEGGSPGADPEEAIDAVRPGRFGCGPVGSLLCLGHERCS